MESLRSHYSKVFRRPSTVSATTAEPAPTATDIASLGENSKICLPHFCYTASIVCALPKEAKAVACMFDEIHQCRSAHPADTNVYLLGRIHEHDTVLACLPAGQTGKTSAARVAQRIRFSFGNVKFALLVGIAGGVPGPDLKIRLGDVVVGVPGPTSGGVIEYDFGKTIAQGAFVQTGVLDKPPQLLLSALSALQATSPQSWHQVLQIARGAVEGSFLGSEYEQPSADSDLLFQASYDHVSPKDNCLECDSSRLVRNRPIRKPSSFAVHFGNIASGDQVMKHGLTRDKIAERHDILCFEMEAAGLADTLPTLVIRGICDYADSHKTKQWQEHAALMAAAFSKRLLQVVSGSEVIATPSSAPFPITDELESLTALPEAHVVRLPPGITVRKLISTSWYGYNHSITTQRPRSEEETISPEVSRNRYTEINSIPSDPPHQRDGDQNSMETRLANFMHKYRRNLSMYLKDFGTEAEQSAVFKMMLGVAEGVIEKDDVHRSLLHYMAMNGAHDVIPALVDAGFNVNAPDSDSMTPLHLAVIGNHYGAVKVLVKTCHADVHMQDLNGALPWHHSLCIDDRYVSESPERLQSKAAIIRVLATVTEISRVAKRGPQAVLKQLKANPGADIEITHSLVTPRQNKDYEANLDRGIARFL